MNLRTPKPLSLRDMTAMMVDDNEAMRSLVTSLLRLMGFGEILQCSTVEEAQFVLKVSHIDILLIEWSMQPVDGLELINGLDSSPEAPRPRIIMLTADTNVERVLAAKDAGVSALLVKPIQPIAVYERILKVLAHPIPPAGNQTAEISNLADVADLASLAAFGFRPRIFPLRHDC